MSVLSPPTLTSNKRWAEYVTENVHLYKKQKRAVEDWYVSTLPLPASAPSTLTFSRAVHLCWQASLDSSSGVLLHRALAPALLTRPAPGGQRRLCAQPHVSQVPRAAGRTAAQFDRPGRQNLHEGWKPCAPAAGRCLRPGRPSSDGPGRSLMALRGTSVVSPRRMLRIWSVA